jgi:hypothetical protein
MEWKPWKATAARGNKIEEHWKREVLLGRALQWYESQNIITGETLYFICETFVLGPKTAKASQNCTILDDRYKCIRRWIFLSPDWIVRIKYFMHESVLASRAIRVLSVLKKSLDLIGPRNRSEGQRSEMYPRECVLNFHANHHISGWNNQSTAHFPYRAGTQTPR